MSKSNASVRIEQATFDFLADLEKHNDRDWFTANKDRYVAAKENVEHFADVLIARLGKHDRIATGSGQESLFRIFNDVRFHKDKPPYKTWFASSLARVKPALRGGYYFRITPGASFAACGFWGPEPADLNRIRVDIDQDAMTWRKLMKAKAMKANWGELVGDQVATAPRGYPKDHEAIDLLRRKQFILRHDFKDREATAPGFMDELDKLYKSARPWFDHMSEVLTTDANGISLLRSGR